MKLITPPSKVSEIFFYRTYVSWGGMGEESFKFWDRIIVLLLNSTNTVFLTITYKMSKFYDEEIKLGSLKFSLIEIVFAIYNSGNNLKGISS